MGSALLGLIVLLLPATAAAAGTRCSVSGGDANAVADARAHLHAACSCQFPARRLEYMRCVQRVIELRIANRWLPSACAGKVRSYAARSTCGRDDAVVCCVKRTTGPWRSLIRADEASCRAPSGGAACVARYPHVDDACLRESGCWESECGDGIVTRGFGEQCEPPNTATCDGSCQLRPCGDGVVVPPEECDPPGPGCTTFCRFDRCGDGVLDIGEGCEPPNTPTCDAQCRPIHCGNGVLEPGWGEECEPPGSAGCDAQCAFVHTCGDRVVERGEECDGQPGCGADCVLERSICCDLDAGCFATRTTDLSERYFFPKNCVVTLQGDASFGICEQPVECPAGLPDNYSCGTGSCGDRPIEPLPLCCQQAAGGCRDTVATTVAAIGNFGCATFPPPQTGPIDRLSVGHCGTEGQCVAGAAPAAR
jgi:hypothetical protein